ncbi:MAG: efflux transporter outer membrane subunit [Caulobacterales bacterium]
MKRALVLVGLAAALAACNISGHRKPDVTLPTAFEAPRGSTVLPTAALDRWWTIFNDAQLNGLEDDALRLSPDAKTQIARLQEARASEWSQIFQTLPTGNLTGSASSKQTNNIGARSNSLIPIGGKSESETLAFDPTWELDFYGGLAVARNVAKSDAAATRFDAEAARASLVANVADSYFQAEGLAIQLVDARESVRIEEQLYAIATRKAELGLGPASDADRIAGDLAQAKSQVESLEAELHAAQRLLLILVGRGVEPVESLPVKAEAAEPPPAPAAVPGEILVRRPDVREAEARMQSAAGRSKLAKLQLFPNLMLEPTLGLARTVAPGVAFIPPATLAPQQQTTATDYWSIGVGLVQPVLDIPRLLADAKAQDARTEQSVIAYEQSVQNAYGDAENALVRLSADERRLAILRDGEARSRRAYEAGRTRYADGLDELTAALTTEQEWRSARSALTSERVQALRRAVQVYKALGGGWASTTVTTARAQ